MATFPSGTLLFSGYKHSRVSRVVRTDMESGPAKQALRAAKDYLRFTVTYRFTSTEFDAFQLWVRDTIKTVGEFDWVEPQTGATKTNTRIVNGDISDARPFNPQLDEWLVTMQLEFLDI